MRMVSTVAFLAVILSGPAVSAGGDGVSPEKFIHQSVSVVTGVDRQAGYLVIKQNDGQVLKLYVDETTAGDRLEALQPGDIIREECTGGKGSIRKARQILVMRPAWREIGSPEM